MKKYKVMFWKSCQNTIVNNPHNEINMRYLAIEIHDEIFIMNNRDELGGLIDKDIPHTVIGRVCTEECNTTCIRYCEGTCPCKTMKDIDGNLIHVFVDSNLLQ